MPRFHKLWWEEQRSDNADYDNRDEPIGFFLRDFFLTLNSPGLLITISTRKIEPDLSYIFSQFSLTLGFMTIPARKSWAVSLSAAHMLHAWF